MYVMCHAVRSMGSVDLRETVEFCAKGQENRQRIARTIIGYGGSSGDMDATPPKAMSSVLAEAREGRIMARRVDESGNPASRSHTGRRQGCLATVNRLTMQKEKLGALWQVCGLNRPGVVRRSGWEEAKAWIQGWGHGVHIN